MEALAELISYQMKTQLHEDLVLLLFIPPPFFFSELGTGLALGTWQTDKHKLCRSRFKNPCFILGERASALLDGSSGITRRSFPPLGPLLFRPTAFQLPTLPNLFPRNTFRAVSITPQ